MNHDPSQVSISLFSGRLTVSTKAAKVATPDREVPRPILPILSIPQPRPLHLRLHVNICLTRAPRAHWRIDGSVEAVSVRDLDPMEKSLQPPG